MIQCEKCNRIIVDQSENGGAKIRARMILFDENGQATALCPTCKHPVPVPLTLGNIGALPKPRLIVKG